MSGQATAFVRSANSFTRASFADFIQITSPSSRSIARAIAQNNAPSPTPVIPPIIAPTQSQNSPGDPTAKVQVLELQITYLKDQIKVLEEKFSNYLLIVSAVFAAIFAFFGVIPFITGKAAERRAQESHKLAIESHNLAIRGETSSQQRATEVHQTFLADSKNTLELVNATLRLAKDASERAATIIQARAERLLRELDRSAKKMLAEAKDTLAAVQYFTRAQGIFSQVADKDQWALFGLGQVFAYLGKTSDAENILAGEARKNAQNEYINRIEPRTKVLARTTEIICCALVPRLRKEVHSVYGDLIESLGLVDSRLTLYSQFQKRNVPRDEFKSDQDGFVKEYRLEEFL